MHNDRLPYVQPGTVLYNPMIKDRVTMLATASSTGGAYTLLRIELAPGGGNGLHTHDAFTEMFTALDGELGVSLNGKRRVLAPGERAVVPPQAVHCFFNASAEHPALFEVELRPANAGFERSLVLAYGLAQDGLTTEGGMPRSLLHLALLVHWSGTAPVGAVRVLLPLLRLAGRRLSRKAKYHALLRRYLRKCAIVPLDARKLVA
ncbi:MAG TPA: cupin domain-containing protein, partial [Flavobacteriales bacterium]|nr:cupin domain-containing protein [Flavobacteriales bacterium]